MMYLSWQILLDWEQIGVQDTWRFASARLALFGAGPTMRRVTPD